MRAVLDTAGERLQLESDLDWVDRLVIEGTAGCLEPESTEPATMRVRIDAGQQPFDVTGWPLLSRGVWSRDGQVVVENVCTSGFDLHVGPTSRNSEFTYRWRPPARDRAAARLLRARFHLLDCSTFTNE